MKVYALAGIVALGLVVVGCGSTPKPPAAPDAKAAAADPTKDSDGDGVPDGTDKCPDKKEDGQAPDPKDGCPSK